MHLVPNQLIELIVGDVNNPQILRTRVEDVYDDVLVVAAPSKKGVLVPLHVGTTVRIEFTMTTFAQEGRFKNMAILEKRFETNVPVLQFRLRGKWEKTQEREFVRVPVLLDALCYPVEEDGSIGEAVSGVILNLSGGGFHFQSSHHFEPNDKIKISFYIEDVQITSKAQLIRYIPGENGRDYGFYFIELLEQHRKDIIKYVFQRQIDVAEMTKKQREQIET